MSVSDSVATSAVFVDHTGDITTTTVSSAVLLRSQPASLVNGNPTLITREEAKNIALTNVNAAESDISRLTIELDYDEDARRWEYEVEFYVGNREYDVNVDAVSGVVLPDDTRSEPTQTLVTDADRFVSRDEAKRLALQRAGVTADKVR